MKRYGSVIGVREEKIEEYKKLGHSIGFCGNSDMQVWETGDKEKIRKRGSDQIECGQGRRVHFPVRLLGGQQHFRRDLRLYC